MTAYDTFCTKSSLDDRALGIHSSTLLFRRADRAWTAALQLAGVALLAGVGAAFKRGSAYFAGATYTALFAEAAARFWIELTGSGAGSASAVAAQWSPPFALSASLLGAGAIFAAAELGRADGVPLGTRFSLRAAPEGDSLFSGWSLLDSGHILASTSALAVESPATAEGRFWLAGFQQGAS